ncbi:dTDP-4-dehydrorhamnose reductase [Labrys okinawensis]|uniref:dTDP-4-dehydrorhamnose reductase n=1 Tax=Labrys okinawensis TaxID=346911 RepID=UPI0039BC79C8
MRVIVTGREGQVARALAAASHRFGATAICLGRPDLDLERPEQATAILIAARPDVIVNAAAYTAVDKAELEPDKARAINTEGAAAAARAAQSAGVPIIQISTDYVFDGTLDRPYQENDATGPLGVYGRTKLDGENAVRAITPSHVILRTAWVYSTFGNNFVRTMLRLALTRDEIGVVADQHGCPTSADDIAVAILKLARQLTDHSAEPSFPWGIYHMAAQGDAVWADVADAVFARSKALGGPCAEVRRIETSAYPTPAKRPANSRLDSGKLAGLGIELPNWRSSLDACVKALLPGGRV